MFTELPKIEMKFNEPKIYFKDIYTENNDRPITGKTILLWNNRSINDRGLSEANGRMFNKPNNYFNWTYLRENDIPPTIIANDTTIL